MSFPAANAMQASTGLWQWLQESRASLAFTTYQSNRLLLVGRKPEGRIAVHERVFDKPMGLYAGEDSLVMSTRHAIWQLENRLAPGQTHAGCDRLYVPARSHTTGDLNVHDVVRDRHGETLFINTDFSCLARLRDGYSFEPVWQPPFISALKAEDRCHLNGLAMRAGAPAYVTACAASDAAAGWRHQRAAGGIVMHIPSNEIVAGGLSMPHSPRWYRGKLWLLNAGSGEFGFLDGERFVPVAACPGFVRGLAFAGDYAVVGMSRLRASSFGGLPLAQRLAGAGQASQCGLVVIDLRSGAPVHSLLFDGGVDELFDVVVLAGVERPSALGFQDDGIERLISFPGSGGLLATKPTVRRPGIGAAVAAPALPRAAAACVKYQHVHHLNAANLAGYEAMTFPSLQARWRGQAPHGELLGVSASVDGAMVALAVAEQAAGTDGAPLRTLLSLLVLPPYRHQGIATALLKHLQLPQPPASNAAIRPRIDTLQDTL
ncbi:TIGR03032 family protein [Massilia sp. CCM 8693]|uniref:TIGR03032 family protein n=2 Tax=Massilia aquatica TaxID=2609000 RepID=A0ABX0MK15_9BURK|nr:TIGR03032 family protein [Massilia aquatica]